MKKFISILTLALVGGICFNANADCYWNTVDQDCCENGEMFCTPEAGADCLSDDKPGLR